MTSQATSAVPSRLVAFPSVSSSLHSLPQATSMQSVSLHSSSNAQRAAESEAKVRLYPSPPPSSSSTNPSPPPPPAAKSACKVTVVFYSAESAYDVSLFITPIIARPLRRTHDAHKIKILDMNV